MHKESGESADLEKHCLMLKKRKPQVTDQFTPDFMYDTSLKVAT